MRATTTNGDGGDAPAVSCEHVANDSPDVDSDVNDNVCVGNEFSHRKNYYNLNRTLSDATIVLILISHCAKKKKC